MVRIVRLFIGVEHPFHRGHKLRVRLGRDAPVLNLAARHPVFFSVRRTVSWLIESTIASYTTRRANRRKLQLA